jgi:hypothetical protein
MTSKKKPPVNSNHVNHSVNSKPIETPKQPEPKAEPPKKVSRIGGKVTYRAAIQKEGKWVDGPGEMNRTGYVVSWGTRWVTILNLAEKKIEYAVLGSAQIEPSSKTA